MVLIFVLPHLVEEARFPLPLAGTTRMEAPWAVHQVQVTLDFARGNPVWTWLLGGLNYHMEHHLFPTICHVNYPGMSKVVAETCREFGVEDEEHPTLRAGLASHYRWLRRMGAA
jgi:linoleoyl-CoA desaturase